MMKKIIIMLLMCMLIFSCQSVSVDKELAQTTKEIHDPKSQPEEPLNVGFLAINGVYNSELMAPFDIFHHTKFHTDAPMKPFIVAPTMEMITTFEGIRVIPDYSFDNVPDIDVLVVPSAEHNMDSDLEDEKLIAFVREKGTKAKYIMSLCDGAFILAQAGLLNDVKCTTFPADIPKFKETFSQLDVYEGVSFIHDGKAITSAGGAKSYDPSLYLVEYLYGKKAADGVAEGMVIDWNVSEVKHLLGDR